MAPSWIVIGLGFGDEGKGTTVDALVRKTKASTVVRFNGGAQAAHNVVTAEGKHHCFSQWGAGTLAGASTVLTKDFILSPLALGPEAKHLQELAVADPMSLLTVDSRALISTPYHAVLNKVREIAREEQRHGSCGVGIGEVMADATDPRLDQNELLRAADLADLSVVKGKLFMLRTRKFFAARELVRGLGPGKRAEANEHLNFLLDEALVGATAKAICETPIRVANWDEIADVLSKGGVVCEGAQGVLLDEWYGFHPHTTWSTTTGTNARAALLCAGIDFGSIRTVGVLRSYTTRHGAGPFPTEIPGRLPPDGEHNAQHPWQGAFRIGAFDTVLARYAIEVDAAVDYLAVTGTDQHVGPACIAYETDAGRVLRLKVNRDRDLFRQEQLGELLSQVRTVRAGVSRWVADDIVRELGVPLLVTSFGPRSDQKTWSR